MARIGDAYTAALERAERARALVAARAYLLTDGAVLVYSDQPGAVGYTIAHDGHCSCADATVGQAARLNIPCKHRLVAGMVRSPARRLPPIEVEE